MAVQLLRGGRLEEADHVLRQVLADFPDHSDALHFFGLLRLEKDDPVEALDFVRRSVEIAPDNAGAWNNLGNLLLRQRALAEAGEAYSRCLSIVPDFPEAISNIGFLLRMNGEVDEAEQLYRRALEARPDFPEALNNLGAILLARGDDIGAEVLFRRALAIEPLFADAFTNLGRALSGQGRMREASDCFWRSIASRHGKRSAYRLLIYALVQTGERDKAVAVARQWLEETPDDPGARHHHAAVTGGEIARASDAYVETIFDLYADSFDASLSRLGYAAPQLCAKALGSFGLEAAGRLDVLDAGCGTGLCAPMLRPYAARLDGIDLSKGMLAKAAARDLYDRLDRAEMATEMAARPATYDVIVSADTLCYFGDLSQVLAAAATALRPGGHMVFTVESLDLLEDVGAVPAGFRVHPGSGRFAHYRAYVTGVAERAGFDIPIFAAADLRMEGGLPVRGYVVGLQCR
ncbi:tetratricopeptide repeat protein [Ancylobacter sp. 6x-1]|uniref:Tetratricopeptide repeat protein n=1 Tax=Ancylobacter crimeensis TaxID=2579147 RepID=A0ABT0D7N3_9HYPH|nr:tetratricopeptide repeat protein [Ancylobacter crimeensis]